MPPEPSGETISYGPSRVPGATVNLQTVYSSENVFERSSAHNRENRGGVGVQWELLGAVARRDRVTPSVSFSIPARRRAFCQDGSPSCGERYAVRKFPGEPARSISSIAGLRTPESLSAWMRFL